MITSQDLAVLTVRRIIFHDVPNTVRGAQPKSPTLADAETELDGDRRQMLKERLTRVIGSASAYAVEFNPEATSLVPEEVRNFTNGGHNASAARFVQMSRRIAQHLFEQQGGSMSPGLLCVIDVVSGGNAGLAMMKLEREQGAELELSGEAGRRRFEMSVLENLVLTDGTRLFKSAIFLKAARDEFRCAACDSQKPGNDVAQFWMRFLGCKLVEEPRVTTQRWFDATVRFVNEYVTDPVTKNDMYEHLVSELKSNRTTVAPRKFLEEYVPRHYRELYRRHMVDERIGLQTFRKDVVDLSSKLRKKAFHTKRGVTLMVPADEEETLIDVGDEQIVVHDQLKSIAIR